jgi:hypothetical protein
MSIEIKNVGGRVLYTAQTATDVRAALVEAVKGGANLGGAYLRGADLYGADLGGAYLRGADLYGANLYGADLRGADLCGADLGGANLGGADLGGADLYGADLRGADLRGADLRGADLRGAKNADLAIAATRILPDEGPIIGWKKCAENRVVKLRIPAKAKRSHASGRKCRASSAKVLAIYNPDGTEATEATSRHDNTFTYLVGETVTPTAPFDDNPWNECAPGIHFYITRLEAEHA